MDYFTAHDVAERLKVSDQQVRKLCQAGRIPHIKHGRLIRIPVAAWEVWQKNMATKALAAVRQAEEGPAL